MRLRDRLHIYPLRCAMHGAGHFWTRRWGYICFKPPTYVFGRWWPWYVYASRNATPWAATWGVGPGFERHDRAMLAERRAAAKVLRDGVAALDHDGLEQAAEIIRRGESVVLRFPERAPGPVDPPRPAFRELA